MDKELKEKWIESLESGKYKKGKYYLKSIITTETGSEENFCCLGVLCEIKQYPKVSNYNYVPTGLNGIVINYKFEDGETSASSISDNIIPDDHMRNLILINDRNETFEPVIEYIKTFL